MTFSCFNHNPRYACVSKEFGEPSLLLFSVSIQGPEIYLFEFPKGDIDPVHCVSICLSWPDVL